MVMWYYLLLIVIEIYEAQWLSAIQMLVQLNCLFLRAVETHFKKPRFFRFFKKPKNSEKLGF